MRNYNATKLPSKILDYFERNPDEELSYTDLAIKFGVPKERVREVVYGLIGGRAKDVLESVQVVRLKAKGVRTDG